MQFHKRLFDLFLKFWELQLYVKTNYQIFEECGYVLRVVILFLRTMSIWLWKPPIMRFDCFTQEGESSSVGETQEMLLDLDLEILI
jgi:hypothetical protein